MKETENEVKKEEESKEKEENEEEEESDEDEESGEEESSNDQENSKDEKENKNSDENNDDNKKTTLQYKFHHESPAFIPSYIQQGEKPPANVTMSSPQKRAMNNANVNQNFGPPGPAQQQN